MEYEATATEDGPEEDDPCATVEGALGDIVKQTRFWTVAREVFKQSLGCGTAVSIYGARRGRLFVDTVKAKWCTPAFGPDGEVTKLEIRYPFLARESDGQGRERYVGKLYRRVIDAKRDTTYLPAKADKDGVDPNWQEDKERTFEHGLGHCPVIWYASMRGVAAHDQIDGHALHENALDEIFALDCSLSQRHRAALMAGDPQWTEIGVEDPDGPQAMGRVPDPDRIVPNANPEHFIAWAKEHGQLQTTKGGQPTYPSGDNPVTGGYAPARPKAARKKGPGEVWRFTNPDAKVHLHTLSGDALEAISKHAADLRTKVAESLCVVFMDPESIKFAASLSGKALKSLKSRQIDRVDQYRDDFGDGWIVPQMQGLLRVVRAVSGKLRLRGVDQLITSIQTLDGIPDLDLSWGEYFDPSVEDKKILVEFAKLLYDAGFATLKMVVKILRDVLDVADVDAVVKELEEQKGNREKHKLDDAMAEQEALHRLANAKAESGLDPDQVETGARKEPEGNAQPGGEGPGSGQGNRSAERSAVPRKQTRGRRRR